MAEGVSAQRGEMLEKLLESIALDGEFYKNFILSGECCRDMWLKRRLERASRPLLDVKALEEGAQYIWEGAYNIKYLSYPLVLREVLADLELKMHVNDVLSGGIAVSGNGYTRPARVQRAYKPINERSEYRQNISPAPA